MFEEGEQVATDFAISLAQPLTVAIGRRQYHDGVQIAVHAVEVAASRARRQRRAPPCQYAGPQ